MSQAAETRRRNILEAAGRVFAREGVDTTIAQVAAEAEVAVGSIYLSFKNKEDLRAAVAEARAARVLALPEAPALRPAPPTLEKMSTLDVLLGAEFETISSDDNPSRRKRRTDTRRREILEAATRVFARRGFRAATMAEVAAEAGLAVGSLYLHFKTKDEIFVSVMDERAAELLTLLQAELALTPTALGKIRRLVVAELEFFSRNREFLRIYLSTHHGPEVAPEDELGEAVGRTHAAYLEMVTAVVRQGVEDGELRAAPPADLAHALMGMVHAVVFKWIQEDDLEPLGPKADWLVGLFSRAAGAAGAAGD